VLTWYPILKIECKRIKVIIYDQNVLEGYFSTCENVKVFDNQVASSGVIYGTGMLLVEPMLKVNVVRVKIIENRSCKPFFTGCKDGDFEEFVGKFKALLKIGAN